MSISWTQKYAPIVLSEIVGQNKPIATLIASINSFKKTKKAVFLSGPPGCGKNAILKAFANEYNLELVELNSSDLRNKNAIEEFFGVASKQASLISKSKILVADEIDGLSGKDRGGVTALIKIIKNSKFPIILVANDPYLPKLKNLKKICISISLNKLNYLSITKKLKEICINEKISFEELTLKKLAISVEGDLRAAINDLQAISEGKNKIIDEDLKKWSRNQEENIFNTLKLIFKSYDGSAALNSSQELKENIDLITYWLDENIPYEYKNKKDRKEAYRLISQSDIFWGRIMRWQHWRFLVYSSFLSIVGVQQAKSESSRFFNLYQRPKILNWMFRRGLKRRKINSELSIAKEKLHASYSNLNKSFWPYYKFIQENNKKMAKELDSWLEIV